MAPKPSAGKVGLSAGRRQLQMRTGNVALGVLVVACVATILVAAAPEDHGAIAEAVVPQAGSHAASADAVVEAELSQLAAGDDDDPKPVAPLISEASKIRAKEEFARTQARENNRVEVTIAKAKAKAKKNRMDHEIAKADKEAKKRQDKAKEEADAYVAKRSSNEQEGKAEVKASHDKVHAKIKLMFDKVSAQRVAVRQKLKKQLADRAAVYKAKMADISEGILKKQAAAKVEAEDALEAQQDQEEKDSADYLANRDALKAQKEAIAALDQPAEEELEATAAKAKAANQAKFDKYDAKMAGRTEVFRKDQEWTQAHDPFTQRYDRLSRETSTTLRKSSRENVRKWRRKVAEQAARISRQGRDGMRHIKSLARKAYRALDHYAHKDEQHESASLPQAPEVRAVQKAGQAAEFAFDSAETAADAAVSDVLVPEAPW